MSALSRTDIVSGFRYQGISPVSSRLSSLSPTPSDASGLLEDTTPVDSTTRGGKRSRELALSLERRSQRPKAARDGTRSPPGYQGTKRTIDAGLGVGNRTRRLPKRYVDEDDAGPQLGSRRATSSKGRTNQGKRPRPVPRIAGQGRGSASSTRRKGKPEYGQTTVTSAGGKAVFMPICTEQEKETLSEKPNETTRRHATVTQTASKIMAKRGGLALPPIRPKKRPAEAVKRTARDLARISKTSPAVRPETLKIMAPPERRGYPSSRFCKVLRVVAGLPLPVSRLLSVRHALAPSRRPPVWAESRQELCEALPYYRAFQSGLYMSGRVAYGYLLEAFPAPRDIWADGGKVVISHGGGQCVQVTGPSGKVSCVLAADQSPEDARVDTLLQAYKYQTPLVLIAGEGYEQLPWKLGCAYAVLGWYWISAMWVEAEPVAQGVKAPRDRNYFHRYKVRFDWVQSQGIPWWLDGGQAADSKSSNSDLPLDEPSPTGSQSSTTEIPVELGTSNRSGSSSTSQDRLKISHLCDTPSAVDLATGLLTPPITPPQDSKASLHHPAAGIAPSQILELTPIPIRKVQYPSWRRVPGSQNLQSRTRVAVSEDSLPFSQISRICPSCTQRSPRVYQEGWICLVPTCCQFWLLTTTVGLIPIPPGLSLSFDQAFLQCAPTPASLEKMPYDVVPVVDSTGERDAGSSGLLRGWVCDTCGRANCRYQWEVWECRNCRRTALPITPSARTPISSLAPLHPTFMGDAQVHPQSGIAVEVRSAEGTAVMVYALPRNGGRIYHVSHRNVRVADELWEAYQIDAVSAQSPLFERRPLKAATVKGALLAQYFAINVGAEYKYSVATSSLPFDRSPGCVLRALDHIKTSAERVLGSDVKFNEILSVMYREGQKMSWHDDGEEGIGPVIASLSLGSTATMSWRRKAERSQPNQPYYLGHEHKSRKANPIAVLELTLSHGDIVIMQGLEMQERYSHRVIPHGYRVAATAREILA